MLLDFENKYLEEIKGFDTLNEICQQGIVFIEIVRLFDKIKYKINKFMKKIWANKKSFKIIFTGVGSSEFIGNSIVNTLIQQGYNARSISSTDIIPYIEEYIDPKEKLLLISFSKSGNSPEIIETYNIVNNFVLDCRHLIFTCNSKGKLWIEGRKNKNTFVFTLPSRSDDKSFVKTSSFTGMILSALLFFRVDEPEEYRKIVTDLAKCVNNNIRENYERIKYLANLSIERIVYLGASNLKGIAQKSHLMILELTGGNIETFYNSPLGFRRMAKYILNEGTMVFVYLSVEPNKRKYDIDLLKELYTQKKCDKIIVLDCINEKKIESFCDEYFSLESEYEDFIQINYIVLTQLFAFYKAINVGKSPDNSCQVDGLIE